MLSASRNKRRYRCREVVLALHSMQHGKCCYCEQSIGDRTHGKHVEHFRPRRFQDLVYCWNNLLLACADCNGAKSAKFPKSEDGEPLLIDPSDPNDDPEDHIEFLVDEKQLNFELPKGVELETATPRGISHKGIESIQVMNLSGGRHTLMRKETLAKLTAWHSWLLHEVNRSDSRSRDIQLINELKDKLRKACGDGKVYAGLARTFYRVHQVERIGI